MIRKLDAMANSRPKQVHDVPKADNIFLSGKGLGYTPILRPDDVKDRMENTAMPSAMSLYSDTLVDNRKLSGISPDDRQKEAMNLLKGNSLSISKSLLDELLKDGNRLDVDGIGKFRIHLRMQGCVFKKAKEITTIVKPYFSDSPITNLSNLYGDALSMARYLCGVRAPTPIQGQVSLVGRLASVSNLELTNQVGNTTYSLTPQVISRHWRSRATVNQNRRVITLYQVDMKHTPRYNTNFTMLAKEEHFDLRSLANGLGFEVRTLSQMDGDTVNSVQFNNLHQAVRVAIMGSNYDLRIIKGCVMYLAALSSVSKCITVQYKGSSGVAYYSYTAKGLVNFFASGLYSSNNVIVYADTPDTDYCLFLKLLLGEISGETVSDGKGSRLFMGGYAIPTENYDTVAYISKSQNPNISVGNELTMSATQIASWLNRYCRGVGVCEAIPNCLLIASILMAGDIMPNIRLPAPTCRQDLFAVRLDHTGIQSTLLSAKPCDYLWAAGITIATQTRLMIKDVIAHEKTCTNKLHNLLSALQTFPGHRKGIYDYYSEYAFNNSFNIVHQLDPLVVDEDVIYVLNRLEVINTLWARLKYGVVNDKTWLHLTQTAKLGPYYANNMGTKTESSCVASTCILLGAASVDHPDGRSIPRYSTLVRTNETYATMMMQQNTGGIKIVDDGVDVPYTPKDDIDVSAWDDCEDVDDSESDSDSDYIDSDDESDLDNAEDMVTFNEPRYYDADISNLCIDGESSAELLCSADNLNAPDHNEEVTNEVEADKPHEDSVFVKPLMPIPPREFNADVSTKEGDEVYNAFFPSNSTMDSFNAGGDWLAAEEVIKHWKMEGEPVNDMAFETLVDNAVVLRRSHVKSWLRFMHRCVTNSTTKNIIINMMLPNAPAPIRSYTILMYSKPLLVTSCWIPIYYDINAPAYVKHIANFHKHIGLMTVNGRGVNKFEDLVTYSPTNDDYMQLKSDLDTISKNVPAFTYTMHALQAFLLSINTTEDLMISQKFGNICGIISLPAEFRGSDYMAIFEHLSRVYKSTINKKTEKVVSKRQKKGKCKKNKN